MERHQQKGVGRELVRLTAQRLINMEIHSMLTWVLEANPACNLYEALGGQCVQKKILNEIGGRKLSEIAYGWADISVMTR
ncbi:MAG: GNAT family N-acetyltransferase [Cyanobacteria bacterium P01_F01_bin.53]